MEFEREQRYIVFKHSDLGERLRYSMEETENWLGRARERSGKDRRRFLVIESDWPEFEPAWDAIQRRMEGRPTIESGLQNEVERLTAERDRYKTALDRIASVDVVETDDAYNMRTIAKKALAEAAQAAETCESCHNPLGDDAPLCEDADICRKCHNEIQAAEAVSP